MSKRKKLLAKGKAKRGFKQLNLDLELADLDENNQGKQEQTLRQRLTPSGSIRISPPGLFDDPGDSQPSH